MKYNLLALDKKENPSLWEGIKSLLTYLGEDRMKLVWALLIVLLNSGIVIVTPYFIGLATDTYIVAHDTTGLLRMIGILVLLYIVAVLTSYSQMVLTGQVAQKMLYRLRSTIFAKIQSLPLAFFQQNKTGDLMARINNDTDKLNQFLSESIMRFLGSFFVIVGVGIFVLFFQFWLALAMFSGLIIIMIISRLIKSKVEKANKMSAAATGALSGQLQESLSNFKVIVAFNRRQYFEEKLQEFNLQNFKGNRASSFINSVYKPIYDSAGNIAKTVVLIFGLYLITSGNISIGTLIAFLSYTQRFYDPLQMFGTIVGNIQNALASWARIKDMLMMENDLLVLPKTTTTTENKNLMQFDHVRFGYLPEKVIIHDASFSLASGKTYAFIGPTGGGKSTMASLMARLYDPQAGTITLMGNDLKSYTPEEISSNIGFILQDALLFSGTIGENIRYGNNQLKNLNDEQLLQLLAEKNLTDCLEKFPNGLATEVISGGENLSLGQKQLVSFMRAILRKPQLLILDEATANIDTVTEQYLTQLLDKLPPSTTKVVIAHRLNTIQNADEIIFINNGHIEHTMDFDHAMHLIDSAKRKS